MIHLDQRFKGNPITSYSTVARPAGVRYTHGLGVQNLTSGREQGENHIKTHAVISQVGFTHRRDSAGFLAGAGGKGLP